MVARARGRCYAAAVRPGGRGPRTRFVGGAQSGRRQEARAEDGQEVVELGDDAAQDIKDQQIERG